MTQRIALVLSIVLTLLVSAGVFAGRDRLFAPESAASSYTATSSAADSPGDNQPGQLPRTNPRIVTVTLPPTLTASSASAQARSEGGEGSVDHEQAGSGRASDEGYEHDEGHNDD